MKTNQKRFYEVEVSRGALRFMYDDLSMTENDERNINQRA